MIEVLLVNEQSVQIAKANAWHVDEFMGLHLKNSQKQQVASFAPTKWLGVWSGTLEAS